MSLKYSVELQIQLDNVHKIICHLYIKLLDIIDNNNNNLQILVICSL